MLRLQFWLAAEVGGNVARHFCHFRNLLLPYKQLHRDILLIGNSYGSDLQYTVIAGVYLYGNTWYHLKCTEDFVF